MCKVLVQKGEHQTRMAEVPALIITGGNILLLIFGFSRRKSSDTNIANFFLLVKTPNGLLVDKHLRLTTMLLLLLFIHA